MDNKNRQLITVIFSFILLFSIQILQAEKHWIQLNTENYSYFKALKKDYNEGIYLIEGQIIYYYSDSDTNYYSKTVLENNVVFRTIGIDRSNHAYIITYNEVYNPDDSLYHKYQIVMKSADQGLTWETLSDKELQKKTYRTDEIFCIHFTQNNTCFAGNSIQIIKFTNNFEDRLYAGAGWLTWDIIQDRDNNLYALGHDDVYFKEEGRFTTFQPAEFYPFRRYWPESFGYFVHSSISCNSNGKLFVTGYESMDDYEQPDKSPTDAIIIYTTEDQGVTWSELSVNFDNYEGADAICIDSKDHLYISTGQNIIVSDEKYQTWNKVSTPENNGFTHIIQNPKDYIYLRTKDNIFYRSINPMPDPVFANTSIKHNNISSETFTLLNNYPNPFNVNTTIDYQISQDSNIKLSVYNVSGEIVEQLQNTYMQKGNYEINWNAGRYSSGIYYIILDTESEYKIHKCILLK